MVTSQERKDRLQALIEEYQAFKNDGKLDLSSEETIRAWLNAMLEIFGWDVRDTSQVLQEKVLSIAEKERLKEIGSSSTRPDYTFKIAKQKLTFLDAKALYVNLETDSVAAFQIKSYGWSISAPCAFISNFEQFVIYNCTYIPQREQSANFGRIFLSLDEYIDNFEVLEQHLLKENIYNGVLNEIYSDGNKIRGVDTISPDFAFADLLSEFRLGLASDIYEKNQAFIANNNELLSYVVQVIINRILFIRICEARKIEENGLLLQFKENGFWENFKASSYMEFYEHYDGPLFERIDAIHNLTITDGVFDGLLDYLYEPSPYRFDVIPTKLLSDIYELFLAKKLKIEDNTVQDELKSEYSKTKGAVSTPQYIVQEIIRRTILQSKFENITQVLDSKILDIACGSGVFAIETYDYLEEALKLMYLNAPENTYKHLFLETEHEVLLNIQGKKAILDNCIFGVDIDPEAVEVAKMSLALKVVDNADYPQVSEEMGLFGSKILNGIGNNIRCGNSLVDSVIFEQYPELLDNEEELLKTNVFDWDSEDGFAQIFEEKGGFDYIIGNPPYVEVKNYNEELPYMHRFIKENYPASKNGKIDLAIPFIEKSIDLLNENGRLGFIVQKRFFKTNYGKKIREIIAENQLVSSIVDFETTSIFKGRITYVALLMLDKMASDKFHYKLFDSTVERLAAELRNTTLPEVDNSSYHTLPNSSISKAPWSFDNPELINIRTRLAANGKFGDTAKIKVGIQVLWDKAYHIRPTHIENGILIGNSHLEEGIEIELAACRPLICNERFTPYRSDNADVYVIFPYDVVDESPEKILFPEFSERFPLAAEYLNRHKETIQTNVQTLSTKFTERYNDEYWHLYTREQNHGATYPKVLLPMTALDTFAMVTFSDQNYCDNVNVNFVAIEDKSETNLYAISGIINSTVFSVLARSIANPQTNGYFKFNKQFIEPVPFPVTSFAENEVLKKEISEVAKQIENRQHLLLSASPNQRRAYENILRRLWLVLDQKVGELYGLNEAEIEFFKQRGRGINRIEFLR